MSIINFFKEIAMCTCVGGCFIYWNFISNPGNGQYVNGEQVQFNGTSRANVVNVGTAVSSLKIATPGTGYIPGDIIIVKRSTLIAAGITPNSTGLDAGRDYLSKELTLSDLNPLTSPYSVNFNPSPISSSTANISSNVQYKINIMWSRQTNNNRASVSWFFQKSLKNNTNTLTSISDINTHSQFANLISISDTNINVLTFALATPFDEGYWTCHFKSKDQI